MNYAQRHRAVPSFLTAAFISVVLGAPPIKASDPPLPESQQFNAESFESAPLFELLTEDAVASIVLPRPIVRRGSDESDVVQWLYRMERLGILRAIPENDAIVRWSVHILSALTEAMTFPSAFVLMDVRGAPRTDGGFQLAEMRAALLVQTDGRHGPFAERVQLALDAFANSSDSRLGAQDTPAGTVYTLTDRRLPSWATISWGSIDRWFVIAVGDGAFEQLIATGKDRPAHKDGKAGKRNRPWLEGETNPDAIFEFNLLPVRTKDPRLSEKIAEVVNALGLAGFQRGYWTIARSGKAIEVSGWVVCDGRERSLQIASRISDKEFEMKFIPSSADAYIALSKPPWDSAVRLRDAYFAARAASVEPRSRASWTALENEAGISIAKDILGNLGAPIVVHDYPNHALEIPLARTIVVPIRERPLVVRAGVDNLLRTIRSRWNADSWIKLDQDTDGIWYLHAGILGPALVVRDDRMIVSFSSWAVRQNMLDNATTSRVPTAQP